MIPYAYIAVALAIWAVFFFRGCTARRRRLEQMARSREALGCMKRNLEDRKVAIQELEEAIATKDAARLATARMRCRFLREQFEAMQDD